MTKIGHNELGHAITLDPERLISTRMLVQANSGGGKSWMLRVLCERLGKTTPLIVLDWEGEFASLREKLDVLLVGREGEVPTAIATAGALATQLLEMGVSAVIDLYDLNPHEKRVYVRRFLESLMAAPKRLWSPRLVIVDEAHNLAPEDGDAESRGPVEDLCCAGRKRQFCAVLATQRLSKLAKDAAAELNNVLIGRCTLDVDQKRACDILGFGREGRTVLRDLNAGEFMAFGPAFNFKGVEKIKSEDVQTTHGAKAGTAKPPEPSKRMQGVVEQLRDLAEKSKTEVLDLDSARATIRELRQKVMKLEKQPAAVQADDKAIERAVAAARHDMRKGITALVKQFRTTINFSAKRFVAIDGLVAHARSDAESNERTLRALEDLIDAPAMVPTVQISQRAIEPKPIQRPVVHHNGTVAGAEELGRSHAQVLAAIRLCHAMGYETPTREQVSFWSSKRGGNYTNLLGALRTAGQIDYPVEGCVRALTEGDTPDPDEAYQRALSHIRGSMRVILDVVLAQRGGISRDELSEASGKSGGNFTNLLGALRTAGLVTYPSKGMVEAAAWLREAAGVA